MTRHHVDPISVLGWIFVLAVSLFWWIRLTRTVANVVFK